MLRKKLHAVEVEGRRAIYYLDDNPGVPDFLKPNIAGVYQQPRLAYYNYVPDFHVTFSMIAM